MPYKAKRSSKTLINSFLYLQIKLLDNDNPEDIDMIDNLCLFLSYLWDNEQPHHLL